MEEHDCRTVSMIQLQTWEMAKAISQGTSFIRNTAKGKNFRKNLAIWQVKLFAGRSASFDRYQRLARSRNQDGFLRSGYSAAKTTLPSNLRMPLQRPEINSINTFGDQEDMSFVPAA